MTMALFLSSEFESYLFYNFKAFVSQCIQLQYF